MAGYNSDNGPAGESEKVKGFGPWAGGGELYSLCRELDEKGLAGFGGLEGSARAFALARLWLKSPRTWLLVTPTLRLAETLASDLEFFLAGEGGGQNPVRLYPSYEVSPYREVDPPPDITARRLAVLWELLGGESPLLVVTSAKGLTPRLPPPEHLLDQSLFIEKGMELKRDDLVEALINGGYTSVSLVEQTGDFAVRGSVVDFFGPLLEVPVRVEFFGDEVESLRSFDPSDQRSQLGMAGASVIPCHPVDLSPEALKDALKGLRRLVASEGLSSKRLATLVERMELRTPFTGLESLLPLYYPRAADLFTYLPEDRLHVILEPAEVEQRLEAERDALKEQFAEAREDGRIVLAPPMLRRTPEQTAQRLKEAPRLLSRALAMGLEGPEQDRAAPLVRLSAETHGGLHQKLSQKGDSTVLARFLEWAGERLEDGRDVALVCRSRSQLERLAEIFSEREVAVKISSRAGRAIRENPADPAGIFLIVGSLGQGFSPADAPVIFVTEDEVLGAPRVVRQKAPPRMSDLLAALDDLNPGDEVVHADHGIGRYEGLVSLAVGPAESDFLLLIYSGGDKLYLPADRMGLISKYRGPEGARPGLDKLGGKGWQTAKGRAQKAVEAIARDLVDLYAARSFQKGKAHHEPDALYREFEAGFPFEETPDQAKAIRDVIADLTAPRPMDRLVCGDVGFGKTEVALRAAYLVASQGGQVGILAPTTVLVEQHSQTIAQRLKNTPVLVESLSRFKTPARQKKILEDMAEGRVDIVVGTHRLLQKDVAFKNLGLLIVDEEHRFGVKDKERLKKLRRMVDVLALTATPIPRTMQMSLSGIRDLSLITTPPEDRQSIKTYLAKFSPGALREAIEREMSRGGQVFFVHNRVRELGKLSRMIKSLTPEARIGVAHGQLNEKSLERIMMKFIGRELDILICTTIIESGLDIPSANTIIINEADKLGLSQIYQLRGRVGRADQKAYAYLFIKSETSLSREAKKRLKALMDYTHLGAGFAIAMHDLQIRGAGNMLGEAQSGRVAEVGYELYVQMLEEAVARLKGEAPTEGPEPELKLSLPALLPEGYVPDERVRLNLYRRLSRLRAREELDEVARELGDRFGPLPQSVENLLRAVELKGVLRKMFAERMDLGPGSLKIYFGEQAKVDVESLLALAKKDPRSVKVYPDGQVSVNFDRDRPPFEAAGEFLASIAPGGGQVS